jgi:hypothetical protein
MSDIVLQTSLPTDDPLYLPFEIARYESLLAQRRRELTELQTELREFRERYVETVGKLLSELAEIEREIKEIESSSAENNAEERKVDDESEEDSDFAHSLPTEKSLRKLFWSIAKLFHPDHAGDEREAERRHRVMAEASRAYREGDHERLSVMLDDGDLQSFCASANRADDEADLAARLVNLKEELRTLEFGIKRIKQDGLYKLKLSVDEDRARGRDALSEMAARIKKQIVQASRKLEIINVGN